MIGGTQNNLLNLIDNSKHRKYTFSMVSKRFKLKQQAISLRQKGESLRSVEKRLKIPKSTLSGWFKNIELSDKQKLKLKQNMTANLIKARRNAVLWHNQQKELRIKIAEKKADSDLIPANFSAVFKYLKPLILTERCIRS